MIEQCAEALAQIVTLVRAGEFDRALILIHRTADLLLGPNRAIYDRLDATSTVELLGPYELDRLRMYAALLGEEGLVRELRGQAVRAQECIGRSLALYAAIAKSGAKLMSADHERIEALKSHIAV
jgi:hypothetical protein